MVWLFNIFEYGQRRVAETAHLPPVTGRERLFVKWRDMAAG
jgi:hypothetical protein